MYAEFIANEFNLDSGEKMDVQQPQPQQIMSWDDIEDDADLDFLGDIEGQPAPKACSIDNPNCEACQ